MQRYTVYLYLENALHVSGCTSTHHQEFVSTASGICHTVTAICRYRGRDGTGLSVLWVAYACLFQSEFSTEFNLVPHLSNSNIQFPEDKDRIFFNKVTN
jgi:hypothetical protein